MKTKIKMADVLRTKVFYWHEPRRSGGLAIDKDGNIRIAIAQCYSTDRLNRRLGRDIVTGRILKDKRIRLNKVSGDVEAYPHYIKVKALPKNALQIYVGKHIVNYETVARLLELANSGKYDLDKQKEENPKTTVVKVGIIGVDAGICWIGDPCYVFHKDHPPQAIGKDWADFCNKIKDDYPTMQQFNYDLGHPGLGCLVSTGFGDGSYEVFAEIVELPSWGKRIKKVWVEFIN